MRGASGRWLVVGTLAVTMLLSLSGVARAAWPTTAGGPMRAQAAVMPVGGAPVAIRVDKKIMTVLIPQPVLYGSTRIAAFDVYRANRDQAPEFVSLTGCASLAATLTCSDLTVTYGGTYTYTVAPRYGSNWVGALSPPSNSA